MPTKRNGGDWNVTKQDYETPVLEIMEMNMQVITDVSTGMTDGGTGTGGETEW